MQNKLVSVNYSKRPKISWFTPELRLFKNVVIALYDRFKNGKGTPNENTYKREYLDVKKLCRTKINQQKRAANEYYVTNSSNKFKVAWNVIKSESNTKKCSKEASIDSDTFNQYFVNLVSELNLSKDTNVPVQCAKDLVSKFVANSVNCRSSSYFKWRVVQVEDVLHCLAKLSPSRMEDYYGLSNKVLKDIGDIIVEPLTTLLNIILEQGVYPSVLKVTKVIPVYKKGDTKSLEL